MIEELHTKIMWTTTKVRNIESPKARLDNLTCFCFLCRNKERIIICHILLIAHPVVGIVLIVNTSKKISLNKTEVNNKIFQKHKSIMIIRYD